MAGNAIAFGQYGLKSLGAGWFSSAQIESARKVIAHHTQRGGKIWIRVFPDKPITQKAAGVRMGSGKGDISKYVAVVKPGKILFEIAGVAEEIAYEAFKTAATKLPFPTRIVKK
ncbi:MAG: 50S ribosomal protein L16 [Microgenomates group bacterium GW2011_GWA1_Microgenomates_45_10]|nr:MAG: 50S ribosomal protein L16 [Microgenomates group bacterium GW2011_GWA2_44_7]KKT78075.1 MAG: 50S ribosomal protein L16 [Microgenomates group bacterium GW2011_GWB1_44_8]KKT87412.1 MAG: 50S ribosomal protein L16 [Microgenomates group bacterium GW2011_GWA1_Microgenomates_45_10]